MYEDLTRGELQRELEELDEGIISLKAQMSSSAVNENDESRLANLERRKNELERNWDRVKSKSENVWEEERDNFRDGMSDVKNSYNYLKDRYF